MNSRIQWPNGKRFAFTIFNDPDAQTLEQSREVYSLLADLGLRSTIGVWPLAAPRAPNSGGETCANHEYLRWIQKLQQRGFEVGFHNGAPTTLTRPEILHSLDTFRTYFGGDPVTMANHYNGDAIYWGPARLSSTRRLVYTIATRNQTANKYFGHLEGHPSFWGDFCRDRIRYCRNFVYQEVNTLKACPWMPYHDPERPFVNYWYASTEGSDCERFLGNLTQAGILRLEEEGGACLMYTHFGHGYFESGTLDPRFRGLMEWLSRREGWFVPVGTLLDFLATQKRDRVIQPSQRAALERRWLMLKLRRRTS